MNEFKCKFTYWNQYKLKLNLMKNIVIFGSSGHCKVIIDIIEKLNGFKIIGIIDKEKSPGNNFFGHQVIGNESELDLLIQKYNIHCGVIAIGDNSLRKKVSQDIISIYPGFKFESIIHPSTNIGKNVKVGNGTVIMGGVTINSDTVIGNHSIINTNSSIDHDCKIGNFVSISPNCGLGGNVKIGDFNFIGIGANISNNINIGDNNVIGASSLVINNIDNNSFGYGIPFSKKSK